MTTFKTKAKLRVTLNFDRNKAVGSRNQAPAVQQYLTRWWNTVIPDFTLLVGRKTEAEAKRQLIEDIKVKTDRLIKTQLGPYIARFMKGASNKPALSRQLTPREYFNTGSNVDALRGVFGQLRFIDDDRSNNLGFGEKRNTLSGLGVTWDPLSSRTLYEKKKRGQPHHASSFFQASGKTHDYFKSGASRFASRFVGTEVSFRKTVRQNAKQADIGNSRKSKAKFIVGTLDIRIFPRLGTSIRSALSSGEAPRFGAIESLVSNKQVSDKLNNNVSRQGNPRELLGPLTMWWYQVILPLRLTRQLAGRGRS